MNYDKILDWCFPELSHTQFLSKTVDKRCQIDCLQLSVNFGGRFSVKAVIPSNLSFCKERCKFTENMREQPS